MSMIDPIKASMSIAGSGLEAQSSRLRVVSENIANVDSTGRVGGADPYRRRTITFDSVMSRTEGVNLVRVKDLGIDNAPFRLEYEPGHQAADENGYVKRPNVNVLVEMSDMRETNRSYEANLQIFKQARSMAAMTIDMLKGSSS
ncbi:MAG: flagellar basal-body rod protein FlgC [Hyphomicrobiales bacterium]|jgi:flagellar basal-body rod protein FlgC